MISQDVKNRLLYLLHRGLVELRLLAQAGKTDQVRDLADLLEVLPSWLTEDSKDVPSIREIKVDFQAYQQRYAGSFNYSDFLDKYEPPPF